MVQVRLNLGVAGARIAYLREPTGYDEMALAGAAPAHVSLQIAKLLVTAPGAIDAESASRLPLSDRDRIVAALYRMCFGDTVECVVPCPHCGKSFELDFSLAALLDNVSASCPSTVIHGPDADGVYTLEGGARFRLPTVEDERAAAGLDEPASLELLFRRCLLEGDPGEAGDAVQAAMEELAPVLSFGLPAHCAECRQPLSADFSMLDFCLAEFEKERALLLREVHCLATAHRWSPTEILRLRRSERQEFVALVLGESARRSEAWVA